MPFLVISHPVLNAKSVMYSIAFLLGTGNAPGNPRHVGHKLMFGSSVSTTPHLQNIFVFVFSSIWVSIPIVGFSDITSTLLVGD